MRRIKKAWLGHCVLLLSLLVTGFLHSGSLAVEYRVGLCFHGCPEGASSDNHLLLRPIYALSYNTQTKSADWVAYKVSADSIGIASSLSRVPLPDNFVSDTLLEADFLQLEGSGMSRSQYVPMINFASTPYWNEVNFLTNFVARSSALNQGAWNGLDWAIRNLVSRENAVFVITGPVYKSVPEVPQLNISKPHRVPDAFFKIVVTESGLGTAFLLDQNVPVYLHHCDLRTSIEEIERATGLNFFPQAPQQSFAPLDAQLGCS